MSTNRVVPIARANISETLAATLRAMIVDGRLAAGERINEVHLSAELGVSRTPLREALSRLAAEGALFSKPRIGYFVGALTLGEFRQIYPIRALLDPEALRLAGIPSPGQLGRLERMNRSLGASRTAEQVIARDNDFHLELVAACTNRVLLDLILQFMERTRRYELALMREEVNVSHTVATHKRILAALRSRDLSRACRILKQGMEGGSPIIERWLEARERASVGRKQA
jgi:DNA-binding GntR family transcriptional regulator